ncbi:MAG: DUF4292 domain-containing protein, partial [Chitinophagaceae bacterium]
VYILFAVVLNSLASCRSTKKITTAITKRDTIPMVIVSELPKADSVAMRLAVLKTVHANKIDFEWFSANKIKADYDDNSGDNNNLNLGIRIRKDSIIWVSITKNVLGVPFEGLRLLVTKDSVKIINKQEKTIQYRSIAYLQEITKLPFNFSTLQDLLVGNPIFFTDTITSFKYYEQKVQALSVGSLFKHLITVDITNNDILHSKLDDADPIKNRTCDITFGEYENKSGHRFSTDRNITVTEKSKLDIHLNFKQYSFNEPQTFPFTVPKTYQVK